MKREPERRVLTEWHFEAVEPGEHPATFELVRTDVHQIRFRGLWYSDLDQAPHVTRASVGTFTRRQLARLGADGAYALAADWTV